MPYRSMADSDCVIVMGSNIQYNNVDMSVVGGDSTVNDSGDIG